MCRVWIALPSEGRRKKTDDICRAEELLPVPLMGIGGKCPVHAAGQVLLRKTCDPLGRGLMYPEYPSLSMAAS